MPSPGRIAAVSLALAASLVLVAAPAHAGAAIEGIDVSQWQGRIRWVDVAAADIRFAIMRATKGRDLLNGEVLPAFVDPTYERNVTRALANGIVVGAYHRATPDPIATDAREEADYFLKHARVEGGDVLPALDIEETGGLTVPELREWVRTWLARVRARTGIRALIYSSPNFWETNMGNSVWFARHGYPLWVAHWDAASPRVPAGNWDGRGWTYWQWTVGEPGDVPGIETAIDRDRFVGADLIDGTIATLRAAPATGGTISGARMDCGGDVLRCERLVNPGDVVDLVASPHPGWTFAGWTGACADAGLSLVCNVPVRGMTDVSAAFQASTVLPEGAEGARYRWGSATVPAALGGSYRWDHLGGAKQAFAFEGSAITLVSVSGPAMGKARIGIDGARVRTLNGWAPRRTFGVTTRFDGLGPGPHTLTVTALGISRARATGTRVAIDGLRWGGVVRSDPPVASGGWGPASEPSATDGTFVRSDVVGASASLAFDGSSVGLVTARGPSMGVVRLWVDGSLVRTVDLFAPVRTFGVQEAVTGLTPGPHVLKVVVVAPAGRPGRTVVVDGWVVA